MYMRPCVYRVCHCICIHAHKCICVLYECVCLSVCINELVCVYVRVFKYGLINWYVSECMYVSRRLYFTGTKGHTF